MSARYGIALFFIIVIAFSLGAFYCAVDFFWSRDIQLSLQEVGEPSVLLDDAGNEWARFQRDQRMYVCLDQLPAHVIDAFIAAEDWRFFEHQGISYKGIMRSLVVNLYHGRCVQGASTITQQLVRLLFFDTHKTFTRKLKEQFVALLVEQRFSKEQILEAYLNNVYFGCGIYGVEAAAQRFWNTHITDVSIDEAATLAAVMRSPANYCPLLCPLSCKRRRNVILSTMHKLGSITEDAYRKSCDQSLTVQPQPLARAPYFKEYIRQILEDLFGKQMLYAGGLRIQTTLNMSMQDAAERSFQTHIARLRRTLSSTVDGGMMSLEVATGQIKAMVGGIDFRVSQYNRATQARRQMGSIFKPLIYAVALNQGASLCQIEIDEPIEVKVGNQLWNPKNSDAQFHGPMTLAHALSHSINTVVVQLLLRSGIEHVLYLASQCGLTDLSNRYPSLALGCIEANVIEAVGMFNIFANHGAYVQPYGISWVKDRWGSKIYKAQPVARHVLQSSISDQIAQVLTHWFERVQRKYPQPWIGSQALCKTGTTNDSRTCWFIGSTPTLTTGMYIGCDDNISLGNNIYPLQTAFPLWMEYNRIIERSTHQFRFSGDLHRQVRHALTGDYVDAHDPHAIELLCP